MKEHGGEGDGGRDAINVIDSTIYDDALCVLYEQKYIIIRLFFTLPYKPTFYERMFLVTI